MPYGTSTRGKRKSMSGDASSAAKRLRFRRSRTTRVTRVGYSKAKAEPYQQIARNNYRAKMNTTLAMKGYRLAKSAWLRSYGPIQIQLQELGRPFTPLNDKPICFDINDLSAYGNNTGKRCQIYQLINYNAVGMAVDTVAAFEPSNSPVLTSYSMWSENEHYAVNAEEHYAGYAVYDISIDGKVDDVTLRFDFVKCKTQYRYYQDFRQFLLPDALPGLTGLAQTPPINRMNPKYFTRTKKPKIFYLNARGTETVNPVQGSDFVRELPATNSFRRNFRFYHKINKVIKQTRAPGVNNVNSTDPTIANVPSNYSSVGGNTATPPDPSYSDTFHRKIQDSEWCIISCNDANDTPLVGDKVTINMTRKCMWRDRVA